MNTIHPRLSPPVVTWLATGALSSIPHLLAIFASTLRRPDFNHGRQFLSELGERGSSTASIFNYFGVLPTGILLLLFGLGLVVAYRPYPLLKIAGVLIAVHGACRVGAALFPCDFGCRPISASYSQVIHNAVATGALLALTTALFIVGAWLIKRREGASIIGLTYVLGTAAVSAQVLLAIGSPNATGLFQRVALGALQLWVVVFSVHIYRRSSAAHSHAA